MKTTFLGSDKSILTVMLQCETPEIAIGRIRNALCYGAEAFGLQVESMEAKAHHPDVYKRLFAEMKNKPCYVTNYRVRHNEGLSDDELADGLIVLAESGATLCDVMGDTFCKADDELTMDKKAIDRQMRLIDTLHSKGAEVLMSSHVLKYTPAERVLEIAFEQSRRGADIIKIVTGAENMEQQLENLKTAELLKREFGKPFLFLSGGESSILRRLGGKLGNCMTLCVYEHDAISTAAQPLLRIAKMVRDDLGF